MFHEEDAPVYAPGFIAVVITASITAGLAIVYRYLSLWENKRRDKSGVVESYEHAYDDDLTDIKVRYIIKFWSSRADIRTEQAIQISTLRVDLDTPGCGRLGFDPNAGKRIEPELRFQSRILCLCHFS